MFVPIGDDNSDRKSTPIMNYLLIAVNIVVFVVYQKFGFDTGFTYAFATVPGEILSFSDIVTRNEILTDPITGRSMAMPGLQPTPIPVWGTLITSMFMHGGVAHLAGNMMFLWIFGDNVEDAIGSVKYLFFYLLCGVLASLCHVLTSLVLGGSLLIPSLGASGAISAVLAAYVVLFPRRRVHVWAILVITVPAFIAVGIWFLFQVINGLGVLGGQEVGGVAYAAHIGGFVAGLWLIRKFGRKFLAARKNSSRWF